MEEWRFNLQLFADEDKTEEATPYRRQEVRRKGQVPRSADFNAAVVLGVGVLFFWWMWPDYLRDLAGHTAWFLSEPGLQEASRQNLDAWMVTAARDFFQIVLPLFAICMGAGLLVNYFQVGFIFSGEPLRPRLENINPVEGFKRIFSQRAVMELVKSLLKVLVTAALTYVVIRGDYVTLFYLPFITPGQIVQTIFGVVLKLAVIIVIAFLGIALMDYLFQKRQFEKRIRMSRFEVKEEFRQTEGDPLVRRRLRERQQQLARQRMMQAVPQATVVITNPTHLAVALQYAMGQDQAPRLVAKGADFLARRIVEVARQHGVPVVENPPVAQALYAGVEVDQEIPERLYRAVAEILAYVYRHSRRKFGTAAGD